jgi:hypothetical protein
VYSLHTLNEEKTRYRLPMIFSKRNQTYFAYFLEKDHEQYDKIEIFLFDSTKKQLRMQKEQAVQICPFWGIYPYKDSFIIISSCSDICWHRLPLIFLHKQAIYFHNASFYLNSNGKPFRQSIEEKGCYDVTIQAYDSSQLGTIHATWVRQKMSSNNYTRDEIIFYSANKDGEEWTPPIEIFSVKNINNLTGNYRSIDSISMASFGKSAFILWRDDQKGIFFNEIRDGIKKENLKISNAAKPDKLRYTDTLAVASDVKIASDDKGNVYALWVHNSGRDYQLFLKIRIDGKWTEESIINKGDGYLNLPDMKIDSKGTVHLTYVKPLHPNEPRKTQWGGEYGCYYMKLVKKN